MNAPRRDDGPVWAGARALGVLLVCALAIRLVFAFGIQAHLDAQPGRFDLIEGDASGYWELARRIVQGAPYELYTPPRKVLRMPGFPLLLAGSIGLFGEHPLAARCLLAVVGTAACGVVYGFGRTLAGERAGLLAAALAAISPTFAVFSVLFLSETAFALTSLASLWGGVLLTRRVVKTFGLKSRTSRSLVTNFAAGCGAGFLAGIATHVRPTWIVVAPLLAMAVVWVARGRLAGWLAAGGVLVGCALLIVPWGLRNQRVTGHFVPTTLWLGASLYDGLRPEATGASEMGFIETDGIYATETEYDADRIYRRKALEFAWANPVRVLELALNKLGRYFAVIPNADQFADWRARLLVALWSLPLLLFAARGAWLARGHTDLLVATLFSLLFFAAVHSLFVGSLRYRLPAEYPLLVLVAIGLTGRTDQPAAKTATLPALSHEP
jgi:4-amino-4-deoxy-L-arabinose transferase-like glycosyltransferase